MSKNFLKFLGAIGLLSANQIGIASPELAFAASKAGMLPSLTMAAISWIICYMIALLYAEVILSLPDGSNFFSMARSYLGRISTIFFGLLFVFQIWYYQTSCFATLTALLHKFLTPYGITLPPIVYGLLIFIVFGAIVFAGVIPSIFAASALLITLFSIFFSVVMHSFPNLYTDNFLYSNWANGFFSLPFFFSAFGFMVLVPTICSFLKRNRRAIHLTLLLGTLIPFLFYISLQGFVISSFPLHSLLENIAVQTTIMEGVDFLEKVPVLGLLMPYYLFLVASEPVFGDSLSILDAYLDGKKIVPEKRRGIIRLFFVLIVFLPPLALSQFIAPSPHTRVLDLLIGFSEIFLRFLPVVSVWLIRYKLKLPLKRFLIGGKPLLSALFLVLFFLLWFEGWVFFE